MADLDGEAHRELIVCANLADRIQARAVRRMGELLKQFDGSTRNRGSEGAHTTSQKPSAAWSSSGSRRRNERFAAPTFNPIGQSQPGTKRLSLLLLAPDSCALMVWSREISQCAF